MWEANQLAILTWSIKNKTQIGEAALFPTPTCRHRGKAEHETDRLRDGDREAVSA